MRHAGIYVGAIMLIVALGVGWSFFRTYAATASYDFQSDTVGQTPANTTVLSGTFAVANQATLGNSLKATTVTTPTTAGIMLDSFASTSDYSVTWKEAYENGGGRHGMVLRAQTGNSAFGTGIKQGYLFQVNHATANVTNAVRIYRLTSGATTQLTTTALTAATPRWFRAQVLGSDLALYYSNDGTTYTQIGATTTDTTYGSGNTQYIAGFGQGVDDMYVDDIVQVYNPGTDGITLTSPVDYQVYQRNGSDEADITITGTYTGAPTAIEASWNGGAYTTIDSSLSGGAFSGTLSGQDAGQGTLTVRFTNATGVTDSATYVGVGDIFVIAGQSNASGRGTNNQSYTHGSLKASMFGNDDAWKELTDPTDSNTGQVDSVSSDSTSATGSVWPLIATHFLAAEGVPVAFIPTAKGGTSIDEWQFDHSASTLYGSMYRRINAVGGDVKAILFFQGETDAIDGMTQSAYLDYLYAFANHAYYDFGVKTVVGQIGNQNVAAANLDAIRLAQIESWDTGTTTLAGPSTADVNLADESGDNLHFKSDADLDVFGDRWWAALDKAFYGGTDGRGPRLLSAEENTARTEVLLTFTDDTPPLVSSSAVRGFVIKNDGTGVGAIATTSVGTTSLRIGLASALTGTVTASFGSGTTISGRTVPTDSSTFTLPAEIFIDEAVSAATPPTLSNGAPSGNLSSGTTGTTLSVRTNENAACRYSTTPGTAWSAMTNAFTTSGTSTPTVNHSTSVSGLTDGTTYTYYVRCADVLANPSTSDLTISFSIEAATVDDDDDEEEAVDDEPERRRSSHRRAVPPELGGPAITASVQATITSLLSQVETLRAMLAALTGGAPSTDTGDATAPTTFARDLALGDTGEDVRALQKFLNSRGFTLANFGPGSPGNETTKFGYATEYQLGRFQAANGIVPAAGYFGPLTRALISSL